MREIKFRAWDFQNKEMIHGVGITPESDLCVPYKINPTPNNPEYLDYYPESTLMQFTGLHDKNGREIYEGDILKRHFEVGREVFDPVSGGFIDYEIDDEGYFVGLVSYRPSGGFILNQCKKFDPEGNFLLKRSGVKIHSQYAEVIGNIHENPELLNS